MGNHIVFKSWQTIRKLFIMLYHLAQTNIDQTNHKFFNVTRMLIVLLSYYSSSDPDMCMAALIYVLEKTRYFTRNFQVVL